MRTMPPFSTSTTPEALLGRNDSKNPGTTCKGLTSSGRPCRRALAASPKASPLTHRRKDSALGGVVAIVQDADGGVEEAGFYCWQHKGQAVEEEEIAVAGSGGIGGRGGRKVVHLRERSSIDTMVQRLGLDAASVSEAGRGGGRRQEQRKKTTSNPRPPTATEARDYAARPDGQKVDGRTGFEGKSATTRGKEKKGGFWTSLCCMGGAGAGAGAENDYVEVVRHKKRVDSSRPSNSASPPPISSAPQRRPASTPVPLYKAAQPQPSRPPPDATRRPSNPQTTNLLSLIPPNLSPKPTSALLAELIKPISPHDEEGYIYIFWLTPQTNPTPAGETARSLFSSSPTQHNDRSRGRRVSDVLTEYSFDRSSEAETKGKGDGKKTIMLKIGRANNVTRRMNEWQRQCGYKLNLVRWYPYVSSSNAGSPRRDSQSSLSQQQSHQHQAVYPDLTRPPPFVNTASRRQSDNVNVNINMVRKVPLVKKVERLIQLELQEQQVLQRCGVCGKEHREWFEVEASRAGVRAVDGCVRRWVEWGEKMAGGG
ncbi:hypothetical protein LTR86_002911 [Recurvomyces mirabilis]|nr:hypothetical protein LTR86_002911 [Recurvomyces mirabilis]